MKPVSSRAIAVATFGLALPRATNRRKRDVRRSWAFHAMSQIIGMAMAVGKSVGMPLTRVVFESAAGAMAGLTWTGLWVVLVPAAYLNLLIVSRPELASVVPDKKTVG